MNVRLIKDKLAGRTMLVLTLLSILIAVLVAWGLFYRSLPLLENYSLSDLLTSSAWKPEKGEFGFLGFIMGTLWVTGIAIILALPLCLLVSIYLSEYAHPRLRKFIVPVVDLLSGIPPVLFGVWGVLFIIPLIQDHIAPNFVENSAGYSVLAGGIVLAIMIFPLLITLFLEVFSAVPRDMLNASLSLGATPWQTVKKVLLKKAMPELERITARVSATRRDRFTARLPMLAPPHAEGGMGAVRIEVRGNRGGSRIVEIAGIAERIAQLAGVVSAASAHAIATGAVTVHGARVLGEPELPNAALLELVLASGIRLHQFVGA